MNYLTEQQINIIHKIPLFRGLSEQHKQHLIDKLDYTVSNIHKGDIIIRQDTTCSHMYILLEGKLEVNIIDVSGNNIKIENIIAPRAFATPHLFDDNNIFPATFTVTQDGILVKATKESVFALISSEPDLLKNFLKITGNCNACTINRLRILSYKSIRSRFIHYLFEHKRGNDQAILEHNQTQLAEYMGVTRPALANEIRKMIEENLISVSGKNITLISGQELIKYL